MFSAKEKSSPLKTASSPQTPASLTQPTAPTSSATSKPVPPTTSTPVTRSLRTTIKPGTTPTTTTTITPAKANGAPSTTVADVSSTALMAPAVSAAPAPAPAAPHSVTPVKDAAAKIDDRVAADATAQNNPAPLTTTPTISTKDPPAKEKPTQNQTDDPSLTRTVFMWSATPNAKKVQLTGSFVDWKDRVDLVKAKDGVFEGSVLLKKGTHMYKFIVDGEWCYDITAKNQADGSGNVNNVIEVE